MNLTLEQYENLNPVSKLSLGNKALLYSTPNRFTKWRVDSLFSKEPVTIEWLNSLSENSILIDIGANVGMYSIWAAAMRGARVFAFEPEAENYALLNRNIHLNKLEDQISAYCMGLLDFDGFSVLHLSDTTPGGSCHSVEQEVGFDLQPRKSAHKQGCLVTTLDKFCEESGITPTHIKVDVDGLEPRVLSGLKATLASDVCHSLIIELNSNLSEHIEAIELIKSFGFNYDNDQVQKSLRKDGIFKGVGEYVFNRT